MSAEFKHRLELIAFTAIASFGAFWCYDRHYYCMCGHLAHGSHERVRPWIEDGIWLFALVAAAVVGVRGRFNGARSIGIVCSVLILCIAMIRIPLSLFGAMILAILTLVQGWELLTFRKKRKAEHVMDVNRP